MPPQLRGSGKGSEKDRNLPTTVTHHGSSRKNGIARSIRDRERGRGGGREGSGSDNDEAVGEEKSNRFLPYITAQPPKNGRVILSDKRRLSSDPRLHGFLGADRGRVQAGENGRPGRQRSVSAENRISIETNMDPQGARNALRVSTSPTLHQHRTGAYVCACFEGLSHFLSSLLLFSVTIPRLSYDLLFYHILPRDRRVMSHSLNC
jgi:hypothetical protein